jgi:hypothetical protein
MTDNEFYAKCLEAGKYTKQWKNKFVSMLPEIVRRNLHQKHGFATIIEFAAKVGGVGKATVKAIFQLENHVKDKPVLKALIPKVGVAKVRVIATIATKENQHDLAKKIQNMSKAALEMYAREERKLNNDVIKALLKRASLENGSKKALKKVTKAVVGKAEKMNDKTVMGKVTGKTIKNKKKSKKITRNSFDKTILSCKCSYPGCNKPAQEVHHPERFSLNPNHNNLKPLCKAHHELVHNGCEPSEWKPQTTAFIEQRYAMARRF